MALSAACFENSSRSPFQMENIEVFVNACSAYGVQKTGLFQTVDLFEMRNLTQVINSLYQLGTEVRGLTKLYRCLAWLQNVSWNRTKCPCNNCSLALLLLLSTE